jgi:hypothetical protein
MTDASNGWPDPSKPGVPPHPERDGSEHWLSATNSEGETAHFVGLWESEEWALPGILSSLDPHEIAAKNTAYLGPCLTPAEVAAALAAQAMAMRLRAAEHVEALREWGGQDYYCDSCKGGAIYPDREDVGRAIRALPLPDTSVLDAMLAEAKREGMREAAGIAKAMDSGWAPWHVAAAILAAAKEDKR